jgi:hypothetical protein
MNGSAGSMCATFTSCAAEIGITATVNARIKTLITPDNFFIILFSCFHTVVIVEKRSFPYQYQHFISPKYLLHCSINFYVKIGVFGMNLEHSVGRPYAADFLGFLAATESGPTIASTRLTERLKNSSDSVLPTWVKNLPLYDLS